MKDVLIKTYNGNVLFRDFPTNFKKQNLYTLVRYALKELDGKTHIDLFNVEYIVNPQIVDDTNQELYYNGFDIHEDNINCIIDYGDYLKNENYIQVKR